MNKRLVGGMILLNLCAISLSVNGGEVDITNEDVKSQLVELRNFIDEKRDFTKGVKDLKPVLVQYRSSVSKIDGVVQCNMGFNTDALHLSIGGTAVLSTGDKLIININVEYEYTDYVGYTIKTAKLNVTNYVVSNGLKMKVAIIPDSLLVESSDRDATDDEIQWIKENYNALVFRKDDYLILQNTRFENESQYISFLASVVSERDNNGNIVQLYQIYIFLNLTTKKVNIAIVDIDNT